MRSVLCGQVTCMYRWNAQVAVAVDGETIATIADLIEIYKACDRG